MLEQRVTPNRNREILKRIARESVIKKVKIKSRDKDDRKKETLRSGRKESRDHEREIFLLQEN